MPYERPRRNRRGYEYNCVNLSVHNCKYINNIIFESGATRYQGWDSYTDLWDLYKLEPNNRKYKKDKMSDEHDKKIKLVIS